MMLLMGLFYTNWALIHAPVLSACHSGKDGLHEGRWTDPIGPGFVLRVLEVLKPCLELPPPPLAGDESSAVGALGLVGLVGGVLASVEPIVPAVVRGWTR
jgi:hypothetical protein